MRTDEVWAFTGANGTGKSTLTQVIAGFLTPSEGRIAWTHQSRKVAPENVHQLVSWCAPSIELYEDFTLDEAIRFHGRFRSWRGGLSEKDISTEFELAAFGARTLSAFSSGMMQRVRLGLALLSDTPLLILDEPTSFLDATAIQWYARMFETHRHGRITCIASNRTDADIPESANFLNVSSFRPAVTKSVVD